MSFTAYSKLPPYVFAVINEMKARLRAAQQDVVDLGMGNPDGATPRPIVNKLIEAVAQSAQPPLFAVERHPAPAGRNRRIATRRTTAWTSTPETEAIVTIGAKDALAHLLFAIDRTRRRRGFAESRLSDSSIRRHHGGRPCLHAADAGCRDVSERARRPVSTQSPRKPQDDPDLVPAQPDDDVRGSGFL